MAERFRVFKVDNMYGVSDDSAQYTVAYDTSKLIMDNLCDLLNRLNTENQQCKEYNAILYANGMNNDRQCLKQIKELEEENHRLNETRDELIHENRNIKNTIQTMLINERTELGRSVLKQLWEAIQ